MTISVKSDTLYSGSAPTITLVGGSDTNQRLLLVASWNNGDGSAATALTVGGVSANFLGNRVVAGGVEASISVFEMINRPAGNYALALTGNGTGTIASADVRWRVIEIDGVAAGGAFTSNVLNTITAQPATNTTTTSDIAVDDWVYTHFVASEGWTNGSTITDTPSLTGSQTVNVTSSGAVSAHRSGYFTAAGANPSVQHQIAGFLTPGGNIDRTTAIVVRFRESAPPPDFTIDTVIEPGETVAVVASNYTPAPTAVTLTDSLSNSLTLALTSTGGSNYTFEVPELPALSANNDFVLFGGLTATIGVVSKPTALQVAGTQTMTTLASGFDDYVFQGWSPQPVAGDQLITNTAECYFRADGDLVWPEMTAGIAPAWYVDKSTGTVYGLQIDVTGLDDNPTADSGSNIFKSIFRDVSRGVFRSVFK